ncbi:MAG: endonuclease III [Alphaproteobacteria bacterium]
MPRPPRAKTPSAVKKNPAAPAKAKAKRPAVSSSAPPPSDKPAAKKRRKRMPPGKGATKLSARLTAAEVDAFFAALSAANPEPKGELNYVNAYTLLVAVVLSAQATDAGVNRATKDLFATVDTPAKMVALGLEGLIKHVRTIGLFNTKAKNVIALSELLIAKHGGEVPRDREALEALPGVGRKTANVVLNIAFGEPTMAVDTHVFRIANRTGLAQGKTPLEVELNLLKVIPEKWALHAHHWLILHGRYVCLARKPDCPACAVKEICKFPAKTTTA